MENNLLENQLAKIYQFEINGTAAQGQTWQHSGRVEDTENDLIGVVEAAMIETFLQLTSGKAVFGRPGVGCIGPYEITKLTLERELQ